jgi:hypothetical protein
MVHKTPNKKRSSNTDPTNIRGVWTRMLRGRKQLQLN